MTDNRSGTQDLIRRATDAAKVAYCPHSGSRVGAAVLSEGEVFEGCNIENDSLGLTMCAERVAIFRAVSSGRRRIDKLAVACIDVRDGESDEYRMPCGACRQVLAQFAVPDCLLIVDGVGEFSIEEILPRAYKLRAGAEGGSS